MELRRATLSDSALLLAWRNDPVTRASAWEHGVVDEPTHAAWLTRKLEDPMSELWIGALDGVAVGQVRLDVDESLTALVDISVAPELRGHGLGLQLLQGVLKSQGTPARVLRAAVRRENERSSALFRRAGFTLAAESADRLVYEKPAGASPG